jgi:hypothetical protein
MEIEVKEFDEIVGTEYVEPDKFVLYRKSLTEIKIIRKKELPDDAILIGSGIIFDEYCSPSVYKFYKDAQRLRME